VIPFYPSSHRRQSRKTGEEPKLRKTADERVISLEAATGWQGDTVREDPQEQMMSQLNLGFIIVLKY
jgi:hypothetical protein